MDMMTCETLECAALYIHFYKEQILSSRLNGIKYSNSLLRLNLASTIKKLILYISAIVK